MGAFDQIIKDILRQNQPNQMAEAVARDMRGAIGTSALPNERLDPEVVVELLNKGKHKIDPSWANEDEMDDEMIMWLQEQLKDPQSQRDL